MHNRFVCLFSPPERKTIRDATVTLCGIGGYGSALIDAFGRYEFREIRLADPDSFEASNMDRQILAAFSTLGKKKVEVAAERIRDITRKSKVVCYDRGVIPDCLHSVCSGAHVIVDMCDSLGARLLLRRACSELRVPLITGGSRTWPDRQGIKVEIFRYDQGLRWENENFPYRKWGISRRIWGEFLTTASLYTVPTSLLRSIDEENAVFRSRRPPTAFGSDMKLPWNSPGSYDPLKVIALAAGVIQAVLTILIGRSPTHHLLTHETHDA